MNFNDSWFSKRIFCTDEEKSECLDTVKEMVRVYETVYKSGILALENLTTENVFLNECKQYLTGGFLKEIPGIYKTLILAGDYHGKEFLQNMIIARGLIAVTEESESYPLIRIIPPLFGVGWGSKVTDVILRERVRCRKK